MLLLCALIVGTSSMWAEDVTFVAGSDKGYISERITIDPTVKKIILVIGKHIEEFDVDLQLAVKENDIMDF